VRADHEAGSTPGYGIVGRILATKASPTPRIILNRTLLQFGRARRHKLSSPLLRLVFSVAVFRLRRAAGQIATAMRSSALADIRVRWGAKRHVTLYNFYAEV